MGDNTAIEWSDATWNPLIGCTRCSEGCDHCYAIGVVHRQMSPQHVGLTVKPEGAPVDWTGEIRVVEHLMDQPLRWKRPRKIFVNSLSDMFATEVSDETILRIFKVMRDCPQHTFQILTKRPQRMADFTARLAWRTQTTEERRADPSVRGYIPYLFEGTGDENQAHIPTTPLPNVWLGTSIESDKWAFRANHLRRAVAAVRFISAEPLLGPLPSLNLDGIDWVIIGGESGPGARPMNPLWARDLIHRILDRRVALCAHRGTTLHGWEPGEWCPPDRAGCTEFTGPAIHFKQWGAWAPVYEPHLVQMGYDLHQEPGDEVYTYKDTTIWPDGGVQVKLSKKDAGRKIRMISGQLRTWDEFPAERERVS